MRTNILKDGTRRRYRRCRVCHHRFKTLEFPGEPEEVAPMSANGNSKLTEHEVKDIRRLLKNGWKKTELSLQYDIGTQAIYQIEKRKTWRHVA